MCGRYAASRSPDDLVEEFEVDAVVLAKPVLPDWNVAPTKDVPVVLTRPPRPATDGADAAPPQRQLRLLRWGLVPAWADDPDDGARLINARVETVAEKPAFRDAFLHRRCLLPADGWYEWYAEPGGPKQPWFLHRSDGRGLALAGIYELWRDRSRPPDEQGAWLWTCAVLTTSAEDGLGHLHDRMPLVLEPERYDAWLDPTLTDPVALRALLAPVAPGQLTAHPVDRRVGDVRANGRELVAPVEPTAQDVATTEELADGRLF